LKWGGGGPETWLFLDFYRLPALVSQGEVDFKQC